MPKRGLLAALTLVLFSSLARAEEQGQRTDDSKALHHKAYEYIGKYPELVRANQEMKALYLALMARFPTVPRKILGQMQQDWEAGRDRECNYSDQGNELRLGYCRNAYLTQISELKAFPPEPAFTELTNSICLGRDDCLVQNQRSSGSDHLGNNFWIVEVSHSTSTPRGETWLIVMRDGKVLHKQKIINESCCDEAGEDVVHIGTHTITIGWTGGANGRGYDSRVWNLDPLKPLEYRSGGSNGGKVWRWDSFTGSGNVGNEGGGVNEHLVIPQLPMDDRFWDITPLGNCSLDLNNKKGFQLAGHMKPPETSVLKALITKDGILIVNVYGNAWTRGASNWLYDDHLEIWTARSAVDYGVDAFQWGIRLADGKVFLAYGQPKEKLDVRIKDLVDETGQKVRAFRIAFPNGVNTVSYSAGDGRGKVNWLLSTSKVIYGDWKSLGESQFIDPKFATCVPENGALNVKRATEFNENESLF